MTYSWYEEISPDNLLEQGDILTDCNVLIPNAGHYNAILRNIETEEPIDIIQINGIVLSQSCDIENNKIDSIIICPIWSLRELMKSNDYLRSSKGKEELRQGKNPSYHLLNEVKIEDLENDFYVVDFRHIYSLPKSYLVASLSAKNRKRLMPPYREHLSQAFARYFMRVGLPTDILSDHLKEYK